MPRETNKHEQVRDLFGRHFGYASARMLPPLAELLTCGRRVVGADLESFLILTIIAVRTFEDPRNAAVSLDQVLGGGLERYESLHTNGRSISESTGIPRETVRRKVRELIATGWVTQEGSNLAVTPRAAADLKVLVNALAELMAVSHALVRDLHRRDSNGAGGA